MTLRELRHALHLMPAVYLDMPVYFSRHGEGLLVQVVAAGVGGMGPEDHPAVHLCHDWGPPESMMRPEVFVHSRAQAEQLPAAEADQLPACPHCQGGRYAPHGDPGWPDALCQTCGGSGIAYGASEDQPED